MKSDPIAPVQQALRNLRLDSPLRKQAEAVLTDPMAPVSDIQPCLYELIYPSPFRKKEHAVAFWLIVHANWSDAQRESISMALSNAAYHALTTKNSSRAILRWLLRGIFVIFPFVLNIVFDGYTLIGPYFLFIDFIECGIIALVLSLVATIVGTVITWPLSRWIDNLNLKLFCPAVEALGHVGPSAYIISLAEFAQDRSLRDVAAPALASVATRMRPEDYGALPMQSVPILCQALTRKMPSQTILVILQVLAVMGDGRAISSVEKLAMSAMDLEVRASAIALLPILQERARNSDAASLLLRASNTPPDPGQTLLRPAREQPDADPSQLLRMATSQEDNERPQHLR